MKVLTLKEFNFQPQAKSWDQSQVLHFCVLFFQLGLKIKILEYHALKNLIQLLCYKKSKAEKLSSVQFFILESGN